MSRNRLFKIFLKSLNNNKLMYVSLLCIMFITQLHAQETARLQITGTVKDELNVPLPGVSVTNQHTKKVNITDVNGKFNIQAAKGDSLVFTYIGFRTFTTAIKDVININVTLQGRQTASMKLPL